MFNTLLLQPATDNYKAAEVRRSFWGLSTLLVEATESLSASHLQDRFLLRLFTPAEQLAGTKCPKQGAHVASEIIS